MINRTYETKRPMNSDIIKPLEAVLVVYLILKICAAWPIDSIVTIGSS